ncbi:MAG: hypothetical protein ACLFP7_09070 [Thiohalospira sp.]
MRGRVLLMTPDRDWVETLMFALGDQPRLDGIYLGRDVAGALRLGSHHDPDAVVLDSGFGEATVAEVIREFRRELTPSLYILLTDEEGAAARRQARAVGARDYLPRGLGAPHLARFVHHLEGMERPPVMAPSLSTAPHTASRHAVSG